MLQVMAQDQDTVGLGVPTFVRLSWQICILNNFSWGFTKYNFFQYWTHPVNAQPLPDWGELVRRYGVSNLENNCIFGIRAYITTFY